MGKNFMSDFVIESKGRCFFCFEEISPELLHKDKSECSTVHSLQYLSRFLRMDRRKVFTDCQSVDIPADLLSKVERSILKASLCSACASANEALSKLCRRLEKIEMEVMNSLDHIYRRLLKKVTVTSQFDKSTDTVAESEHEWNAKRDILNALREDAIHKCSNKLKSVVRPKLKVQCLTARDILKEKRKCILSSSKSLNEKYNLRHEDNYASDFTFSSSKTLRGLKPKVLDDVMHEPIIAQTLTKVELDEDLYVDNHEYANAMESPSPSDNWQPPINVEIPVAPRGQQQGHTVPHSQPRISDNIERIKPVGQLKMQFRCKLCKRVFSDQGNTIRHLQKVHLKTTKFSNKKRLDVDEQIEVISVIGTLPSQRKFRCKQCSKLFYGRRTIVRHVKEIHLRERKFRCTKCPKTFSQGSHLRGHLMAHSGIKPYACKQCDKTYSDKRNLNNHEQRVHNENAHKPRV